MRYQAAEKLETIRLVEHSSLSVRRTLAQLGIPRATFYRWYQRYLARGAGALGDGRPAPRRVWNKVPETLTQLSKSPVEHRKASPCDIIHR
jgi:putative transposase